MAILGVGLALSPTGDAQQVDCPPFILNETIDGSVAIRDVCIIENSTINGDIQVLEPLALETGSTSIEIRSTSIARDVILNVSRNRPVFVRLYRILVDGDFFVDGRTADHVAVVLA